MLYRGNSGTDVYSAVYSVVQRCTVLYSVQCCIGVVLYRGVQCCVGVYSAV